MISNLHFLGIYEDAIDNAIEKAENLLKMDEFSFDDRVINRLHNVAKENLHDYGRIENITNTIIYCYFQAVKYLVTSEYPNAQIEYYVNCNDSHLYYDGTEVW